MTGVRVHVDEVVLHDRTDRAAVEQSIVEAVTRALGERGLDTGLVSARTVDGLDAPARDGSARSIGDGVARALTQGIGP